MGHLSKNVQIARTPTDRYRQILRRVDVIQPPSASEQQTYYQWLRLIAKVLPAADYQYQLEGGLAIAMHCGKFTRQHGDIDVAVLEHQLPEIEARLAQSNYRLFSRNAFHLLEYSPWDVLRPVSSEEVISSKRVKRLTAVKVNDHGRVCGNEKLLPRFDVHIHRIENEMVRLDRGTVLFPGELFHQVRTVDLDSFHSVKAASLPLMYFYKLAGRRTRHRHDLRLIEQHSDLSQRDQQRACMIFEDYIAGPRNADDEFSATATIPMQTDSDSSQQLPLRTRSA